MELLAYHGKEDLKKSYIDRLEAHRKAEELVQGVSYEKNGQVKGCNIGCLFDYYDHAKGAKESGIPEVLLRLADTIFEGLPVKEANDFAIAWPKAIKPGSNLGHIRWQFCAFIMRENIERVLTLNINKKLKEQVVNSIRSILNLHEKESTAESAAAAAWSAARSMDSTAESAELAAAWSAARSMDSTAESAAWTAVWSAESAAWTAVWSAESAAWTAARSAKLSAYKKYAKEFIQLLKAAQ